MPGFLGGLSPEALQKIKEMTGPKTPKEPAPAPVQEEPRIRFAGDIFEPARSVKASEYRYRQGESQGGFLGLAKDALKK